MHLLVMIDDVHDAAHAARYLRNIATELEQKGKPHWSMWNGGGGNGEWRLEAVRGEANADMGHGFNCVLVAKTTKTPNDLITPDQKLEQEIA